MAVLKGKGKSAFVKEYFVDHPKATGGQINEAWRTAGNSSEISSSLISTVRKQLGLKGTGRRGPRTKYAGLGSKTAGGRTPAKNNGRPGARQMSREDQTEVLIRLEGQIDDMIHEAKITGGFPDFEEALRKARRILARGHQQ